MKEPNEEAPIANANSGFLLLLLGAGLTGFSVVWPLWQIQHQAPEISYSAEGSAIGILALILGTAMLIAPAKTAALLKLDKNNIKLKDVLVAVALTMLGFGFVIAMNLYFSSKGYH